MRPNFISDISKFYWKSIASLISLTFVSGFIFSYAWGHRRIIKWKKDIKKLTKIQKNIIIINTNQDWEKCFSKFKKEAETIGAIGLDCEWVTKNGVKQPVALLQIANYLGYCILIRLNYLKKNIPISLKEILENNSIIKVGVGINIDQKHLLLDHNLLVRGCLDLRYLELIKKEKELCLDKPSEQSGFGLKYLANKYLGKTLNKDWRLRQGNWEANNLTDAQINYAAEDALVGIQILLHQLSELMRPPSLFLPFASFSLESYVRTTIKEVCNKYLDIQFREKSQVGGLLKRKPEVPLKPLKESSYSTRKTPLYHNSQLWAPDNEPLCTCDPQKALWYVDKGLGELITEDPLVVKLNFEPAGRPIREGDDGQFYLEERFNICVVCGKDDSYIRKNIVPHEYRRYFPNILKSHQSHDVVLLCVECHQISNIRDNALRITLAEEFDAPFGSENNIKFTTDRNLKVVRSAANALLKSRSQLPESRIKLLETILKDYFKTDAVTMNQLKAASVLDFQILNEEFVSHGYKVYLAYKEIGLILLEQRWRQWFLDSMKPKYLSDKWSVEHNNNKLKVKMSRYAPDHPIREDYKIALVGTKGHIDIPYTPNNNKKFTENFFGL